LPSLETLPIENGSPEGSDAFKNWQHLRSMKVKRIYPAHGRPNDFPIQTLEQ
jgi:hypothetical protein